MFFGAVDAGGYAWESLEACGGDGAVAEHTEFSEGGCGHRGYTFCGGAGSEEF